MQSYKFICGIRPQFHVIIYDISWRQQLHCYILDLYDYSLFILHFLVCDTIGTGDVEMPMLYKDIHSTYINISWNKPSKDIDGFKLSLCGSGNCVNKTFSSKRWHIIEKTGITFAKISALRYSCGGILKQSTERKILIGKLFFPYSHIPRLN